MSAALPVAPEVSEVTWTAGAVARMLEIPTSTLRGWHRRYDIPPMGARGGRHRRYTDAEVQALVRMKQLIEAGVGAQSASHLAFHAAGPDTEVGHQDVVAAALRLDTDALSAVFDGQFAASGVVDTWHRLCCPALNLLGGQGAEIVEDCVDVVHLLSWAITVSLHRVVRGPADSRAMTQGIGRPPVLLACTEGERHVLPLEVLRAALTQQGVPARLLGPGMPDPALRDALRRIDPAAEVLLLWSHSPDTARTTLVSGSATRLVLAGPGWAPADQGPTSLLEAIELLAGS